MISHDHITQVMGSTAIDSSGTKIGRVSQVYLDDETGEPAWATVNTGLFGTNESFVPLSDASLDGDQLKVQHEKDMVKGAPQVASGGHISPDEEAELYRYYGVGEGDARPTRTQSGTTGHDTSGPTTDQAMTRSEEHLRAGTESREAGRARLRKHVVTEQERVTVPVSHEEVRVERVTLSTETVTEREQVTGEVRKEVIDVDDSQVDIDAEGRRQQG